MTDLGQIKEKQKELEQNISDLLGQFRRETGCMVDHLHIEHGPPDANGLPYVGVVRSTIFTRDSGYKLTLDRRDSY